MTERIRYINEAFRLGYSDGVILNNYATPRQAELALRAARFPTDADHIMAYCEGRSDGFARDTFRLNYDGEFSYDSRATVARKE